MIKSGYKQVSTTTRSLSPKVHTMQVLIMFHELCYYFLKSVSLIIHLFLIIYLFIFMLRQFCP